MITRSILQAVVGSCLAMTASSAGAATFQVLGGLDPAAVRSFANDVSADGTTIVGNGINPDGQNEAWIAVLSRPVSIPGDYNRDGVVNAGDYVVWRNTDGQTGPGLAADGNGDQTVDDADYQMWRTRFGEKALGAAAGSGHVPEPATILLIAIAAFCSGMSRRAASAFRSMTRTEGR